MGEAGAGDGEVCDAEADSASSKNQAAALPAGVRAMTDLIDDAPAALRPRLAACGVSDSAAEATALQSRL